MFRDMFHDRSMWRAMGRHGGHGGWNRGGGRFFGENGGDGVPGGRKLSSADLQLLILGLLGERPAHGYELIRRIEEVSGGFYAPSPGMVYPALTFLEETDKAAVAADGNRKLYSLTESGRAELERDRERFARMLEMLKRIGARMEGVREAYAGLGALDGETHDALHRARHALKAALLRARGSGPEEMRRITAILERAAAEIAGGRA
ncbi:MAG: helix-turn-helix transcriptional regulator [Gluconacetobacter diazotrophicus]|nr:helix-turn-helix transcriptional regulator [Gluconacetobacter diazotrophicus]